MSDWQPSPVLIDEDLDRPYEPWQPRVGQRVRVRISAECQFPHMPGSDGLVAEVLGRCALSYCRNEHPHHRVLLGHPVPGNALMNHYTAMELEPLEEVPTAEQPAVASGA